VVRRDSVKARMKRKVIVVAMVKASIVGLIVPLLVVALSILAAFLFRELHVFVRVMLMILFGLAGLGLGAYVALRIIEEKIQPSLYLKENAAFKEASRKSEPQESRN